MITFDLRTATTSLARLLNASGCGAIDYSLATDEGSVSYLHMSINDAGTCAELLGAIRAMGAPFTFTYSDDTSSLRYRYGGTACMVRIAWDV